MHTKTSGHVPWDLHPPADPIAASRRQKVQRFPRHLLSLPLFLFQERTRLTSEFHTFDISLGGLFIAGHSLPLIDDVFRIRLDLPLGGCATVARVVHVREQEQATLRCLPVGFGLEFCACPTRTFRMLKQVLNQLHLSEGAEWTLLPPPH